MASDTTLIDLKMTNIYLEALRNILQRCQKLAAQLFNNTDLSREHYLTLHTEYNKLKVEFTSILSLYNDSIRNQTTTKLVSNLETILYQCAHELDSQGELILQELEKNSERHRILRTALQAEIDQLRAELALTVTNTTFDGSRILDGNLRNAQSQVGSEVNQTVAVSIQEINTSVIGSNEPGVGNGIEATTHSEFIDSATAVRTQTSTTVTLARLRDSTNGQVSFNLYGVNTTPVEISATTTYADLQSLVDAINAQAGVTNITAVLGPNGNSIILSETTGIDIMIINFSYNTTETDAVLNTATGAAASATDDTAGTLIISGYDTSVNFVNGDFIIHGGSVLLPHEGFSISSGLSAANSLFDITPAPLIFQPQQTPQAAAPTATSSSSSPTQTATAKP